MRMRKKKHGDERLANCGGRVVHSPVEYKGKWNSLFGNEKAVHLEIGCGKGRFVTEMALRYPDINFVAIEKNVDVLILAAEKAFANGLKNIKFISADAEKLSEYFESGEINRIYLNFSDPWHKTKHYKRRLTYSSFLELYKNILTKSGELHMKTDNRGLFDFSLREFSTFGGLDIKNITYDLHSSGFKGNILTEYEEYFSKRNMPIYRCEAVFNSQSVTL